MKISGLSGFQAEKGINIIRILSGTPPTTPALYAKTPLQPPVFSSKLQIIANIETSGQRSGENPCDQLSLAQFYFCGPVLALPAIRCKR